MTSANVSIPGPGGPEPRISIGIPLYRSRRFVDRIVRNIEAIDDGDVEFIVSDRHSEDDAAGEVARRFSGDGRVRVVTAADRLDWVEHYNRLLTGARGTYFMWMPHDDEFPAGYVARLAAALDEQPGAMLAYGDIERVDLDGRPAGQDGRPGRSSSSGAWSPDAWSPRVAARRLINRDTEAPFRGVFRRDVVHRAGLLIRGTRGNVAADTYWVFAAALLGPFRHVEGCACRKAYYPASTHARWVPIGFRQYLDARRVLRGYVADLVSDPADARACLRGIDRWAALGAAGVAARRLHIPPRMRRVVERRLSRLVS